MLRKLLTIGAYGFSEEAFYKAVVASGADLFCDIRARRGMRGPTYAFANAKRLEAGLKARGVRYTHCKELAPSKETRQAQWDADAAAGVAKRARTTLTDTFINAYKAERLAGLDSARFAKETLGDAAAPVFFCVEREACACHRSVLVERISHDLGVPVEDLTP